MLFRSGKTSKALYYSTHPSPALNAHTLTYPLLLSASSLITLPSSISIHRSHPLDNPSTYLLSPTPNPLTRLRCHLKRPSKNLIHSLKTQFKSTHIPMNKQPTRTTNRLHSLNLHQPHPHLFRSPTTIKLNHPTPIRTLISIQSLV